MRNHIPIMFLLLLTSCGGPGGDSDPRMGRDSLGAGEFGKSDAAADSNFTGIVTASGGRIYLGGNKIVGPYELGYAAGQLTVNGLMLPPPAPPPRFEPRFSPETKAEIAFVQHVADVAESLHTAGHRAGEIAETLRAMCNASPFVDSVSVDLPWVHWRSRSGGRKGIELLPDEPYRGPVVSRASAQKKRLEHLRTLINSGADIFFFASGNMYIPNSARFDSLVSLLQSGGTLEWEDRIRIPAALQEQLRKPLTLVRVGRGTRARDERH